MATVRKKKRRILSAEAAKRRSEITRQVRPWLKSTGPRTQKGRVKSRMNALRHGDRNAKNRAIGSYVAAFKKTLQCLRALNGVYTGVVLQPTYFLHNATLRTLYSAVAQVKADWPGVDCNDPAVWTEWLRRYRQSGEVLPDGLTAEAAQVPLLTACQIWWREQSTACPQL